jgi:hypothetical protein
MRQNKLIKNWTCNKMLQDATKTQKNPATKCYKMQQVATSCYKMQQVATRWSFLVEDARRCKKLQDI